MKVFFVIFDKKGKSWDYSMQKEAGKIEEAMGKDEKSRKVTEVKGTFKEVV